MPHVTPFAWSRPSQVKITGILISYIASVHPSRAKTTGQWAVGEDDRAVLAEIEPSKCGVGAFLVA
jgi:hypothetical protein